MKVENMAGTLTKAEQVKAEQAIGNIDNDKKLLIIGYFEPNSSFYIHDMLVVDRKISKDCIKMLVTDYEVFEPEDINIYVLAEAVVDYLFYVILDCEEVVDIQYKCLFKKAIEKGTLLPLSLFFLEHFKKIQEDNNDIDSIVDEIKEYLEKSTEEEKVDFLNFLHSIDK